MRNTWKFSVYSHVVFMFSFTGSLLSTTVQHRPTAKQKHYGTTVPLQLVGKEWKPTSQLPIQVNNSSWLKYVRLPVVCPSLDIMSWHLAYTFTVACFWFRKILSWIQCHQVKMNFHGIYCHHKVRISTCSQEILNILTFKKKEGWFLCSLEDQSFFDGQSKAFFLSPPWVYDTQTGLDLDCTAGLSMLSALFLFCNLPGKGGILTLASN